MVVAIAKKIPRFGGRPVQIFYSVPDMVRP